MDVVEDDDEVRVAAEELHELGDRSVRIAPGRYETAKRPLIDLRDSIEGGTDLEQEQGRVVVRGVERDPGHRTPRGGRVLGEERRLSVADGRRHRHEGSACVLDSVDEVAAIDEPRPQSRRRELRLEHDRLVDEGGRAHWGDGWVWMRSTSGKYRGSRATPFAQTAWARPAARRGRAQLHAWRASDGIGRSASSASKQS